jgi:hypothetical protein
VWQNSAPFGRRPIGGTVEALLTKVVNRQLSVSPIVVVCLFVFVVVFFVAPCLPRRCWHVSGITLSNGAESIILSAGSAETIMLSAHAERIILSAPPAESIIVSVPPAESMILSAPLVDATHNSHTVATYTGSHHHGGPNTMLTNYY